MDFNGLYKADNFDFVLVFLVRLSGILMLSDHAEFPRTGNFCTLISFLCIYVQIQDCIVCEKEVGFKFFVALFKGAHVIRKYLLLLVWS